MHNINFDNIWEILNIIQNKSDFIINFSPNVVKSSKWFKTENYEYLLKYLYNNYFTWSNLNLIFHLLIIFIADISIK